MDERQRGIGRNWPGKLDLVHVCISAQEQNKTVLLRLLKTPLPLLAPQTQLYLRLPKSD